MFDRKELIGKKWTLKWEGGAVIKRDIALLENGTIGNITGINQVYWDVVDHCLCFLNNERYCTSRFNRTNRRDDGTFDFAGRFTLNVRQYSGINLIEQCPPFHSILGLFESLGDNCEFGIFQRYYGVEPLGLFRFNWTAMDLLLKGLDDKFTQLSEPDSVTVKVGSGNEYLGYVKPYGFQFHTDRRTNQASAEDVIKEERKRLLFLRRKLFDDLEEGNKILVRKGNKSETLEQIIPLYERLRKLGPNTLLWVTQADESLPEGFVEKIQDGLLHGSVRAFAPNDNVASRVASDAWAKVCRNALNLLPTTSLLLQSVSRSKWVAREDTHIKASTSLAKHLNDGEKFQARGGDVVEAEHCDETEGHMQLSGVWLNSMRLPERDWFIFASSWRRS